MNVVIAGGSGFIGRNLSRFLVRQGCRVTALSRNPENAAKRCNTALRWVQWDGKSLAGWSKNIDGCDVLINLAGENIGAHLWSKSFKAKILSSRIDSSRVLLQAVKLAKQPPLCWLQGSATGFYGAQGDRELDEQSPVGCGFMADVVREWEASVAEAETMTRLVFMRTGVVLGRGEGALKKMALPYKLFAGGVPGSGRQWVSWIHIHDQVRAVWHLMQASRAGGAYNLVAPNPATMAEFSRQLAQALQRPNWLPVPEFALRLLLGEFARETILASQRVFPKHLLEEGFQFEYAQVGAALREIYQTKLVS